MPLLTPFLVGRVPLQESTTEKVGTLILTSLLEDLVNHQKRGILKKWNHAHVLLPWSLVLIGKERGGGGGISTEHGIGDRDSHRSKGLFEKRPCP